MDQEDIEDSSNSDHPETNHKSEAFGAKPYVNNQNYLSTVYNVDDDRTITSSNNSNSHNTEQDNDNQNPIDISDSNSHQNSEASQLSIGQQLSVGGYTNQKPNKNYNIPTYGSGSIVGQQPHYNGNQHSGVRGKGKNVKSTKSSRWNSNKNSAVKMMDRQYQKTYFGCEIQTPEKGRDGVMDIYDLGMTGERLDASESRYGCSGGKGGSQVKRRDYSGSARKNLNFNGNAGQPREVFRDQTQYYQNQKNCEEYNAKYLRKRAKMDMHKKQDACPMNDQDSEPYQSSRGSLNKNGGSRRNGRMEMMMPQMTCTEKHLELFRGPAGARPG